VVLIGSVARRTRTTDLGDVDVVVLNGRARTLLHPGVQTTVLSTEAFGERVRAGDDFAQWALRFGVSIRGRRKWLQLRRDLLEDAPWPNPATKLDQARRRLRTARELLDMGDSDAAHEDLLYAAGHLARAKLLSLEVFPLSRPELPGQLRDAGLDELASALDRLRLEHELPASEVAGLLEQIERTVDSAGSSVSA
jgi:hypothetical protein